MEHKVTATDAEEETPKSTLDLQQEKEIIFNEFKELIQFGKPANFTFYVFSAEERLFSFTFTGNEETYLKEMTSVALLLTLIDHPKFMFVYNSFLPYMGGKEYDAIVIGLYDQHEDLDLQQTPYTVVDNVFSDLSEELTINPSVSLISDEILVTLKTIKLSHFTDKHSILESAIEYLESLGIEFCYYGNCNKTNIENKLNRHYIIEDLNKIVNKTAHA
jgi:hypothetical protein